MPKINIFLIIQIKKESIYQTYPSPRMCKPIFSSLSLAVSTLSCSFFMDKVEQESNSLLSVIEQGNA